MNKKGMTLVEIMVGFAVFSVVMALSVVMVVNAASLFIKNTKMNDDKIAGDAVYNLLTSQLVYATHVQIGGEPPKGAHNKLWVEDGKLYLNKDACYPDAFYQTKRIRITTQVVDRSRLRLQVLVTDNTGEQRYITESILDIPNISLYGQSITGVQGSAENLTIYYDELSPWKEGEDQSLSALLPPTVANETEITAGNQFFGEYDAQKITAYRAKKGYVLYQNNLYRLMNIMDKAEQVKEPGTVKYQWKKIQLAYDSKSSYAKGDVIRYGHWFYRSTADQNETVPGEKDAFWVRVQPNGDRTAWEEMQ